jgi:hypothetical protein
MQLTYNFTDFSALAYLKEYYSDLTAENKFLLDFYHAFYTHFPQGQSVIELGGGPTIFLDITASYLEHEIVFSEFAPSCRDEVIKYLESNPHSWSWDDYLRYTSDLFKQDSKHCKPADLKQALQTRIKAVIPCDLTHENPFTPSWYQPFDILSLGSVVDTIAATEAEFIHCLKSALNTLKPGGAYIAYFAKNCRRWTNDQRVYTTFPVDETYIRRLFPTLGLTIDKLTNSVPPDYQQDYEGIFAVTATKT